MKVSDFTYDLPEELIAINPPTERGTTRLLVVDRSSGNIEHQLYSDFADYLKPGDVVILNDTKVIKARLVATNSHKQLRELLLLEDHHNTDFMRRKALYRGKIRAGETLDVNGKAITIEQVLDGGICEVSSKINLLDLSEQAGSVPLPPYMHREATKQDTERYQTVFAREPGSVAAPTASLNFTNELQQKVIARGAKIAYLTLHVGLGTFLPIRTDDVEGHKMHSEYFEIPYETIQAV
jgi:S-adenosylmethionine:tRNA ribosyltransferase-isomerase